MLEERIADLIQLEVDRETTEPERRELRERLDRDPDARLHFDQMLSVADFLERAPVDDPPLHFADDVMRSVRAQAAPKHARIVRGRFGASRDRYLALRFGVALAAVVLIAFVLAPSLFRTLDSSRLGGSMVAPRHDVARTWRIPASGSSVVHVVATPDRVTLRLDGASDAERVAEASFDAQAMRIEAVDGAERSDLRPGHIRLAVHGRSAAVYFVRTSRQAVSLTVSVRAGKMSTFGGRIEIPAATNF